jgi:hypothetical protein
MREDRDISAHVNDASEAYRALNYWLGIKSLPCRGYSERLFRPERKTLGIIYWRIKGQSNWEFHHLNGQSNCNHRLIINSKCYL